MSIVINPEISSFIPPSTEDELRRLEEALKIDGCRDPLLVWKGTLIDGHQRFKICTRLGIKFKTSEIHFKDKNAALAWVFFNQVSRRNLTTEQRVDLALKYEKLLLREGGLRQNCSVPLPLTPNLGEGRHDKETLQIAAKSSGVSAQTVRNAKKVQADATPEIAALVKEEKVSISAAAVVADLPAKEQKELADAGPEAVTKRAAEIRSGKAPVADDPERPWAQFEAEVEDCISDLRAVKKKLTDIFEMDEHKRFMCRWARGYNHIGTVGAISHLMHSLADGIPAKLIDKPPGYSARGFVKQADDLKNHRAERK